MRITSPSLPRRLRLWPTCDDAAPDRTAGTRARRGRRLTHVIPDPAYVRFSEPEWAPLRRLRDAVDHVRLHVRHGIDHGAGGDARVLHRDLAVAEQDAGLRVEDQLLPEAA